ncbi:MAG: putative rane protein conserved, family [Cyanobacteria bacterium RYN_339]|nr:putative rane protein conserved, family [Cyanobacteria bacterium RYN_339]
MHDFGVLVALGCLTGFLSGLFGLGGGFLLVPALALLGWPMKAAIGTSLFYVSFIGVSATFQHLKAGNVDRGFVAVFALTAVLLAPLGAFLTSRVPEGWLTLAFGLFLGGVALSLARSGATGETEPGPPPATGQTLALGAVVGFVSGLFGVGGGLLFVPAQVALFKIPIKRAVGNSLAGVLLTGMSGMVTHLALGHVDWRQGLMLVAGGLVGIVLGTKVLQKTPNAALRKALAAFLFLVAIDMAYRGFVRLG